jgi:hypothetical protein
VSEGISDDMAIALLRLLCEYFEAYPGQPVDMTCDELAGDLIQSLPSERLAANGLRARRNALLDRSAA